ncbi:MAG: Ppx/GppA family phosphatase [Phycisphaerales bacterium]|nr:Ppx/GppA family phosphatase [Phycisphaerales bacterium]
MGEADKRPKAPDHNGADDGQAVARRVAAIDIGSNSVRLIVAQGSSPSAYRLLTDEKENVRLARGVAADRSLSRERMLQAADVVQQLVKIAEGYGADPIELVATAAVRDAPNRGMFIDMVRERTGRTVRIISGAEEGRFAHESVAHAFDLAHLNAAVVDIGGGSTEIVLSTGGVIEHIESVPLGAVRLADRFGPADLADSAGYESMTTAARDALRKVLRKPRATQHVMIGTGGTFTTLAGISIARAAIATPKARRAEPPIARSIRGYELTRADVRHTIDWLRAMTADERKHVRGLSADRAEIIVPGLVIVEEVMRSLNVNVLRVHDRGVRDGLILDALKQLFGPSPLAPEDPTEERRASVIEFGRRCNFEQAHSEHVARLALSVFDQVKAQLEALDKPVPWGTPRHRMLLEAAALLRDVGYFVTYKGHHKHSYFLIANSDLEGFDESDTRFIAAIARYHRKGLPKRKHEAVAALPRKEHRALWALGGILRMTDGLDRTQSQAVTDVSVELAPPHCIVRVQAATDPRADLWGAHRKRDMFERAFDLTVRFEWDNAKTPDRATPAEPKAQTSTAPTAAH